MNIIELPVADDILRLNWNRDKFSAIIPVSKDKSTLYYDGMKLDLNIGCSTFNNLMDSMENEDNLKDEMRRILSQYVFKGEFFNTLNNPSGSHLQHTQWTTNIIKVYEKNDKVKVQCKTNVLSSYIVNYNGKQATHTVCYEKRHLIDKCKTRECMVQYLLRSLSKELIESTYIYDKEKKWSDEKAHTKYGPFRYFYLEDMTVPLYKLDSTYLESLVDGFALEVEFSRFGSIETGRQSRVNAEIEAHAQCQAAKIIAFGPIICEKLRFAEFAATTSITCVAGATERLRAKGVQATKYASNLLNTK